MIWADRVAVVWAVIAAVVLALFALNTPGVGRLTDGYFIALAIVAGVPWILLRAAHWIFTGGRSSQR